MASWPTDGAWKSGALKRDPTHPDPGNLDMRPGANPGVTDEGFTRFC